MKNTHRLIVPGVLLTSHPWTCCEFHLSATFKEDTHQFNGLITQLGWQTSLGFIEEIETNLGVFLGLTASLLAFYQKQLDRKSFFDALDKLKEAVVCNYPYSFINQILNITSSMRKMHSCRPSQKDTWLNSVRHRLKDLISQRTIILILIHSSCTAFNKPINKFRIDNRYVCCGWCRVHMVLAGNKGNTNSSVIIWEQKHISQAQTWPSLVRILITFSPLTHPLLLNSVMSASGVHPGGC